MRLLVETNNLLSLLIPRGNDPSTMKGRVRKGYEAAFSDHVRRYDELGYKNQDRAARIQLEGLPFRDARVLDVGCGTGALAQVAFERGARSVICGDISAFMLHAAMEKSTIPHSGYRFCQLDAENLPFRDRAFDATVSGMTFGTPCVDLTLTGDSRFLNGGVDRILLTWEGLGESAAAMYAGEFDLRHPYVSPIYGELSEFPPSYLISGTRDLVLSDAVRAHRAMRRAGVEAELHIYEGQSHGDYLYVMDAPESEEHYAELNRFVVEHLSVPLATGSTSGAPLKEIRIPKSAGY